MGLSVKYLVEVISWNTKELLIEICIKISTGIVLLSFETNYFLRGYQYQLNIFKELSDGIMRL